MSEALPIRLGAALVALLLASCASTSERPTAQKQLADAAAVTHAPTVEDSTVRVNESLTAVRRTVHAARDTAETAAASARDAEFAVEKVAEEINRLEIDSATLKNATEALKAASVAVIRVTEEAEANARAAREAGQNLAELEAKFDSLLARVNETDNRIEELENQVVALQKEKALETARANKAEAELSLMEDYRNKWRTRFVGGSAILGILGVGFAALKFNLLGALF